MGETLCVDLGDYDGMAGSPAERVWGVHTEDRVNQNIHNLLA